MDDAKYYKRSLVIEICSNPTVVLVIQPHIIMTKVTSGNFPHVLRHSHPSHIAITKYNSIITPKLQQFMTSVKVKELKANEWDEVYHYGIKPGSSISEHHILSLILYCDFTEYCSSFSSTFRKLRYTETFGSVKARNREFWFQSKYLRETIQLYGSQGYERVHPLRQHNEQGPYYTGIKRVMVIPQYSCFLYSPTSTSHDIEVSINFADKEGMIIQFNTNGHPLAHLLTNFDSSWLSRYPHENERIFMFGITPIHIESVRIIKTGQNYENIFKPLYILDALVSGAAVHKGSLEWGPEDEEIVQMLLKSDFEQNLSSSQTDPYALSMIKGYLRTKNNVTINLSQVTAFSLESNKDTAGAICNGILQSGFQVLLLDYLNGRVIKPPKVVIDAQDFDPSGDSWKFNLISFNIFKIFPNIKTLIIKSDEKNLDRGYYFHFSLPFNMFYFLDNISQSTTWNRIEIHHNANQDANSWIYQVWTSLSQTLKDRYKSRQLSIQCMVEVGINNHKQNVQYQFIIQRDTA